MLAFTELDADFDDENLNTGMASVDDILESPTEAARPARKKGLTQKVAQKAADLIEEEEESVGEEQYRDDGFGDDYGAGFGDDSFDQEERVNETPEAQDDDPEDAEHAQEVEEEDIYGHKPAVRRGKGRPKVSSQKSVKKSSGRPRKQSQSVQPAPKRARTSAAPASPKIMERREVPREGDISMMDADGTRLIIKFYLK
jgi:hypothetical protein